MQLFGEVPFNFYRRLDLTFGAGFVQRGGAFGQTVTDAEMVLDNSNTEVPYTRLNSFSASLAYIDLSGGLRITPLKRFPAYFSADLDADIPAGHSVTYTQTESIVSPQGVLYPQNHSTTLTDGEGAIEGANTLFGIRGTLGYELPFGPMLTASPELSYYYPLNEVEVARPWRVSSVSLGVAFRWNRPANVVQEEPIPPPQQPTRPPIVQHEDPNALAPKLKVSTLASEPFHIIETTVTETFPILPYIFFDSASGIIPDRFAQISTDAATHFKESELPHRSLESYYQILNVIGSRMLTNPEATLTINGTTDGREDAAEGMHDASKANSRAGRAIAVRDYLNSVWKIEPTRLIITTTDVPKNPSSTEYPEGFEENRRAELSSDDDRILKPIVHERFREESAPCRSRFLDLCFLHRAPSAFGIGILALHREETRFMKVPAKVRHPAQSRGHPAMGKWRRWQRHWN